MADWTAELEALAITPSLRLFLRAEFRLALRLTDDEGRLWSPEKAYREIVEDPDIPGKTSIATLERFATDTTDAPRGKDTLIAVAGFLIAGEFVVLDDIVNHQRGGADRLAVVLARRFPKAEPEGAGPASPPLDGVYRHTFLREPGVLEVSTLTIASVAGGDAMTGVVQLRLFEVSDTDDLMAVTEGLDPQIIGGTAEFVGEHCDDRLLSTSGSGAVIAAPGLAFAVLTGTQDPINELLAIEEVRADADGVTGLRISAPPNTRSFVEDVRSGDRPIGARPYAERDMDFYPQDRPVERLPAFGAAPAADVDSGEGRTTLGFMDDKLPKTLTLTARILAVATERGVESDAALLDCADATERLITAIDLYRPGDAVDAVRDGALLNILHPSFDLPLIHTAAALGMTDLVVAMLERGDVELAVRDKYGRLASGCAEICADDLDLSDRLLDAEIAQFRAKGRDPRRPRPTEQGRDPSAE
ncbi:MAG: hypothetical protein QNJ84_02215 [Alphaproteobacteria bacterium]|nr:hypothetical protein [Alphaproteobacteria bacterium]